jgi:hypothetical protein
MLVNMRERDNKGRFIKKDPCAMIHKVEHPTPCGIKQKKKQRREEEEGITKGDLFKRKY